MNDYLTALAVYGGILTVVGMLLAVFEKRRRRWDGHFSLTKKSWYQMPAPHSQEAPKREPTPA